MKKVMILLAIVLTANVMMAQKKDRTDAFMYNKNKQYDRAVTSIEKCVNHEQFMGMKSAERAKAWHYRGEIYYNVYLSPEFRETVPNALELAVESYGNCVATDPGYYQDNYQDIFSHMNDITRQLANAGADAWNAKDFATSSEKFYKAYQVMASIGALDLEALTSAAQAALNGKEYEKAIGYFTELQDKGQNDINIYKSLAAAYNGLGNTEKALEMITAGLEKEPNDPGLLIEKVNVYISQGKSQDAINDLLVLNEQDPGNVSILYAIGTIYGDDTKEDVYNMEKAIEFYSQAIATKPDFYDAKYNLGILYLREGGRLSTEAKQLDINEMKRYDELNEMAKDMFNKSLPFLKDSYEVQPSAELKSVLKSLYIQLNMLEEAKALDAAQ